MTCLMLKLKHEKWIEIEITIRGPKYSHHTINLIFNSDNKMMR